MKCIRYLLVTLTAAVMFSTAANGGNPVLTGDVKTDSRPKYRQGEVVVKLRAPLPGMKWSSHMTRTGLASLDALLSRYDVSRIEPRFRLRPLSPGSRVPDLSRLHRITFSAEYGPLQVANVLARDPHVEYAEPISIDIIERIPDDPDFTRQYHLTQIHAVEAWDYQLGDTTLVIAIVDNGTQLDHPDLRGNLWSNEIEAAGIRGLDDDGNGYIDDIHGYDIAEEDGDPSNCPRESGPAYYSHGTHTAGLAAAMTNNGIGVSGVSWNCEFMPVKASFDEDPQYVDKGYDGIVYAAESGADIISCSWGSFKSYSQADQDVIHYAYALGSMVVAAAGNDARSDLHYPSSYMNVISVAWVDGQDRKASGATWGISVDVAAPGSGLWSTVPTDGGSYSGSSGSSMATPLVSGLCALVKAQHPDWSNDSIARQVVMTADNIDVQNPLYVDQLGSGRINALRAVTETEWPEIRPRLELFSLVPSDSSSGDGDGFFERGEQVNLQPTLRNYALSPAQQVTITLDTDDPDLQITDGLSSITFFPPDTIWTAADPMVFSISSQAEAHMAAFYVEYSCAEGTGGRDTVSVIVGRMPILLVDDDDGENNIEGYYTMLLDTLQIEYAHWEHLSLGSPSFSFLQAFPTVVWMCEWNFPALDEADQAAIGAYLDNGGNLFLSGQDIGWDFYDPEGYAFGSSGWYEHYLHAVYLADDCPVQSVVGRQGDIIADGLSFDLWQPGRASANQYPDEIMPTSDGQGLFMYRGGEHHYAGVRYEGDYRVLYLGFGFEAINGQFIIAPHRNWETRMEVLKRTLNWMSFVQHEEIQDQSAVNTPIPVSARIDEDEQDQTVLDLMWRLEEDSSYTQTGMERTGDHLYVATIPPPRDTTTVYYYFSARTDYFRWNMPAGAGTDLGDVYSFRVGNDQTPPLIGDVEQIDDTYRRHGSAPVKAQVTDPSGVQHVTLYAQVQQGPVDSFPMLLTVQPDIYEGILTWSGETGDEVSYMIEASDSSALANTVISPAYSFHIINGWTIDDFESGTLRWNTGQAWDLAPSGHNSSFSITDSPQGLYGNAADNALIFTEPLDLSACSTAALTFWHAYDMQQDHDFGLVEVSTDSLTWHRLAPYSGFQPPWAEDTVSLADFCGDGYDHVSIRFRFTSDESGSADGWYLDDIMLWIDSFHTGVTDTHGADIPQGFALEQNYPNPFNPTTTISYSLPVQSIKSKVEREGALDFELSTFYVTLKVFNVLGQEIRTLVDEMHTAGHYAVSWDGADERGQAVASGIYLCRLVTNRGEYSETKRMLLLR